MTAGDTFGVTLPVMVQVRCEQCVIFIAQNDVWQQQGLFDGNAERAEIATKAARRIAEQRRTASF